MPRHDLIAFIHRPSLLLADTDLLTRSAQGFTAVLAAAPQPALPLSLPRTRAQMLGALAQRQAQLETLMTKGTVLPVHPRTTLRIETAEATIAANLPLLEEAARWLDGLVQYQVTIRWTEAKVLAHFRDAPEIAPLFAEGNVSQGGLNAAIRNLTARLRSQMRTLLDPVVNDLMPLPTDEGMLLNIVVLVAEDAQQRLDRALERIDAIWPEGLSIRQIGPAPATSFALLHLTDIGLRDLHAARVTLSPDTDSADSLHEARRRKLMAGTADAGAIRQAFDLLEAARRAGTPNGGFSMIRMTAQDQGDALSGKEAVA